MESENLLREIISQFIKIPPSEITGETPIDKRAIKGSVLIHRMYALLEREGFKAANRHEIKTFGDLLASLCLAGDATEKPVQPNASEADMADSIQPGGVQIGMDIELIKNMPIVTDFRADLFYTDNFSQAEISYCILQSDPYQSFAGKFAAKEAVVKADNKYRTMPFKKIEILNDAAGKPFFADFSISITHAEDYAAAVALRAGDSGAVPVKAEINDALLEPLRIKCYDLEAKVARLRLFLYAALACLLIVIAFVLWKSNF